MIKFSAPGKIHLLGEHSVVYGKPAILAAINLRVAISITKGINKLPQSLKPVEKIIKDRFQLKTLPPYLIKIDSQIPIGAGLGSSASISAVYIAALLSFLKIKWDLKLINDLAFEAEKVFHGNPSGGDNTTVVHGGLIWFEKGKTFIPLFSKIKDFFLIDSGKPIETTKQMIEIAKPKIKSILDSQEQLVKKLAIALRTGDEDKLIQIIRAGEENLEKIGVVGRKAKKIIREVEKSGGAAKILGGGGFKEGSGMILCYHGDNQGEEITIGTEGLRRENNPRVIGEIIPTSEPKPFDPNAFEKFLDDLKPKKLVTRKNRDKIYRKHLENKYGKSLS